MLGSRRNDAYEAALAALREDTQEWWADLLARNPDELDEGEKPATADAEGLCGFLEDEVLPWLENRKKELVNRPLIREQALVSRSTPTSWSGSAATRSILTGSWSECWRCCFVSRTSGKGQSNTNPFGKTSPALVIDEFVPLRPTGLNAPRRRSLEQHHQSRSGARRRRAVLCWLRPVTSGRARTLDDRRYPFRDRTERLVVRALLTQYLAH